MISSSDKQTVAEELSAPDLAAHEVWIGPNLIIWKCWWIQATLYPGRHFYAIASYLNSMDTRLLMKFSPFQTFHFAATSDISSTYFE